LNIVGFDDFICRLMEDFLLYWKKKYSFWIFFYWFFSSMKIFSCFSRKSRSHSRDFNWDNNDASLAIFEIVSIRNGKRWYSAKISVWRCFKSKFLVFDSKRRENVRMLPLIKRRRSSAVNKVFDGSSDFSVINGWLDILRVRRYWGMRP